MDDVTSDLEHRFIDTGAVTLHAVEAGPADGEPVVLLHGFPEFWYGWRRQIPALAEAGYRVIAPDQRGYNRSDKPAGLDAYTVDVLAGDLVHLLDTRDHESARFIGHDWGAAVLWQVLLRYPERVDQGVIMNGPHPAVLPEVVMENPRQLLKSYYLFLFQIPNLPEWVLQLGGWWILQQGLNTSNRADAFNPADLERYRKAWSRPGALKAMLNWYRALLRRNKNPPPPRKVTVPTLIVWGEQDAYLVPEMAEVSLQHCTTGQLKRINDATHWLHHEVPERVNRYVTEFFGQH